MGWSVSNAGSGDNLAHGFATESAAYAWLEANVPADEHDSVVVEPEDTESETNNYAICVHCDKSHHIDDDHQCEGGA